MYLPINNEISIFDEFDNEWFIVFRESYSKNLVMF